MKKIVKCCFLMIASIGLLFATESITPGDGYSAVDVLTDYAFNNVNYTDGIYYANGSGADGVSYANIYSELNGLENTLGYPVAYYDSCQANELSIFCSFVAKDPVENRVWVGFTSTGNADDRIFTVDIDTKEWTEVMSVPGVMDIEFYNDNIYVSAAASFSDPHTIYMIDTTGTASLVKIIEVGGYGCGFGIDTSGAVVCASYSGSNEKLFRWSADNIDSVYSSGFLTSADAEILSALSAGGADTDVDDAGNIIYAYNDYSNGSAVDMWNGTVGDADNSVRLATGCGTYGNWFAGIACDGDVTQGGALIVYDYYVYGFTKIVVNSLEATMTANNTTGEIPLTVSCTASAVCTGEESVASYAWDFNEDGVIDTMGESVTYTYTQEGVYDITLIAQGQTLVDTLTEYDRVTVVESLFAGPVGSEGTSAMAYDSSAFIAWAAGINIERGPVSIKNPEGAKASYGSDNVATGAVTSNSGVVSLGDGGTATLTFASPLYNGEGPDFAVFENSFSHTFLELAFVEVSSDGEHFVRFPAVSLTPTDSQVGGFGSVDCRYIHNLAGKYKTKYGTPFDLDELSDADNLDINAITHVRIVDAVGCIEDGYCTYDSQGHKVNDPWPTAFASSGFDLDGVGVAYIATLEASMEIAQNYGKAPFTAEFTGQSIINGAETLVAYHWDLNSDGVIDTTAENFTWTYTSTGQYDVTLIAEGTYGSDTVEVQSAITVISPELFDNVNLAVLMEGNFGASDAGLFSFNSDSVGFVANSVNPLGDTGQSMNINNNELYVVVNGSNMIKVFDISDGAPVYDHEISLPNAGPRYIDFDESDNAYISCWNTPGVLVYDLENEVIEDTLSVDGLPEDLIWDNNHLYVSQNMLSDYSAGTKVYDFDLSDGSSSNYTVASNPGDILLKDGVLYVTSQYYDESWNTYTATSSIELSTSVVTIKEHGMDNSAIDLFVVNDDVYRVLGSTTYRLNQDLSLDSTATLGHYTGIYSAASFNNIVFMGLSDYAAPDQLAIVDSLGNELGVFPVNGACPGSILAWLTPENDDAIADVIIPETTELQPAYPNPFNPVTRIPFTMSTATQVKISVYNIAGRKIATLLNSSVSAGHHEIIWNAGTYSSGIYFVRMEAAGEVSVRKITLQK